MGYYVQVVGGGFTVKEENMNSRIAIGELIDVSTMIR